MDETNNNHLKKLERERREREKTRREDKIELLRVKRALTLILFKISYSILDF